MQSDGRCASVISTGLARIGTLTAALCALAAVMLATGCSSSLDMPTITDPYEPQMERLDSTRSIPVYVEVRSEHGNQHGVQLDGDLGLFVLAQPHDEWLSDGLSGEFRRAGFDVHRSPNTDIPRITAEHVDFRGEYYYRLFLPMFFYARGGWASIVAFDVEITIPGSDRTFQRRFVATDDYRTSYGPDEDIWKKKLFATLSEVYEEIVTETHRLLATGTR